MENTECCINCIYCKIYQNQHLCTVEPIANSKGKYVIPYDMTEIYHCRYYSNNATKIPLNESKAV